MPFFELKQKLSAEVASLLKHPAVTAEALQTEFTAPPTIAMGHLALPCFTLGKILGKPTDVIAKEIAAALDGKGHLSASAVGPYVNFRWAPAPLYATTLERIFAQGARYGADETGKGKRIVLEYCSPNIAKRLAFQHIRSTLIGNTVANVYEWLGYKTERINFVGDWGTQFARLLAAVELWGEKARLTGKDIPGAMSHLFDLYVRFHKELDSDPKLADRAARALKLLEENDPATKELWRIIRDISLASAERTLKRMHIRFHHVEGESKYVPTIDATLAEVKAKARAQLSEGAWIVDVPDIPTPALVQKRDGTTLYLTRDLAAAIDRNARFSFEKMLYVVSEQQKLHFQLLFGVLGLMGNEWAKRCHHVSFGTVLFGAEKMSTREGNVIFLDDVLDEAKRLALAECAAKNPALADKDDVAEMVGLGAVIFGELSVHRQRDLEFDWKQMLALDGETGPYVQYTAVRCASLLAKAQEKGELAETLPVAAGYEFSAEEETLLVLLAKFGSVLHQVRRECEPYHLTHFLIDCAKAFNRFYNRFPVLQATDPASRALRLGLVRATRQVLVNGLQLLGIDCPKEM